MQAWALARNANSISQLYYNLRYEGNPGLFHLFLFVASRFTDNYYFLKYFNFLFIVLAVFLVGVFAPFKNWQKVLLVFGYYFLYEYGTVSRHYALTLLLTIVGIISFRLRDKNPFLFVLLSSLVAFTSPYGTLISLTLLLTASFVWVKNRNFENPWLKIASLMFGFALLALTVVLASPPEDGSYMLYRTYKDPKLAMETVARVWQAYVPIPRNEADSWNSNFVKNLDLRFGFSVVLFLFIAFLLRKKPTALVFYLIGTFLILLFCYIKFSGAVRHYGHLYLIFFSAMWLYFEEAQDKKSLDRNILQFLFSVILIVQIIPSAIFFLRDFREPFSNAEAAAKYIKDSGREGFYLIGDDDTETIPVANYLKKEMYLSKNKKERFFIKYDQNRTTNNGLVSRMISSATELSKKNPNILLILDYPLETNLYPVTLLKQYGPTLSSSRGLYIYEFNAISLPTGI